jgi:PP-loop superfamily ATP-utilizing enzyme
MFPGNALVCGTKREQGKHESNVNDHVSRRVEKLERYSGHLGRAHRRTYSELEAALAEIEAEPDNETTELRTRLLTGLRQRPTSL